MSRMIVRGRGVWVIAAGGLACLAGCSGHNGNATGVAGAMATGGSSGAGGGAAGTKGSGGAAGAPVPTACTGQAVPFQPPVTMAVTIDCRAQLQLSIAAGPATDEAEVAFTTLSPGQGDTQLAAIRGTDVSVEVPGIEASQALAIVDPSGATTLIGSELDNHGVGFFVRSGASWQREMVSPIPTDPSTFYMAYGAALGTDGQPRVLLAGADPASLPLTLAQRGSAGTWTSTQIAPGGTAPAALTIDSKGRARVFYTQTDATAVTSSLHEWVDGVPAQSFGVGASVPPAPLGVAAGLNGIAGVAGVANAGIAVLFSDGAAAQSQLVPGTAPGGTCDNLACVSGPCKVDVLTEHLALTATSDGAFWLAYAIDHIDRYITATSDSSHPLCLRTTTTDRSTEEIVLVRLVPDGSTPVTPKWRVSAPLGSTTSLALASNGPRLYLAVSDLQIRAFALDWTNL
jgi:hypothetical protein